MPGELAASLEVLFDEGQAICARTQNPVAEDFLARVEDLARSIPAWFHKRERTGAVLDRLSALNRHFAEFESATQVGYILRMKQEQQSIRRAIIRAHTIRETSFIGAGYRIAEDDGAPDGGARPRENRSVLRVDVHRSVIVFLLSYLILLIHDLENPFAYYVDHAAANVSLKPLEDCIARLAARATSR
jgi:hypothetical protein